MRSTQQIYLTWAAAGVAGATGPRDRLVRKDRQEPRGYGCNGSAGSGRTSRRDRIDWPGGSDGTGRPAGSCGTGGCDRTCWLAGATGPVGPSGQMGPQGPQGLQGPTGVTGPTGLPGTPGTNGTNGTQSFLLVGGDLGFTTQVYNLITYGQHILLGSVAGGVTPVYYGPGNGADVPLPAGNAPNSDSGANR